MTFGMNIRYKLGHPTTQTSFETNYRLYLQFLSSSSHKYHCLISDFLLFFVLLFNILVLILLNKTTQKSWLFDFYMSAYHCVKNKKKKTGSIIVWKWRSIVLYECKSNVLITHNRSLNNHTFLEEEDDIMKKKPQATLRSKFNDHLQMRSWRRNRSYESFTKNIFLIEIHFNIYHEVSCDCNSCFMRFVHQSS